MNQVNSSSGLPNASNGNRNLEMDSSSHSTTSSLLDHSFHNLLVSATRSRERVSSSWSQFLDWQTLNVDDSLDSDSENYQQSRLSLPHGFCCSGVGGFRAALLSGQLSDDDLEVLFTRSRKFLLIGIHGERLFNPRSIYMFGWQFLNLVCTILCALFVPIEVAFLSHDGILSTQLIGAFFEVFFILDMILNFNLPIYNKDNGSLIGNRESIRAEYFKHWFWIDLVSSLPLDVCELSLGMDRILSVPGFFDLVRVIRVLKIFKLLRLLRTDSILRSLQNHITFKQLELQSLKLLFLILIAIHSMSCGLFIVAEWEDTYSNWIEENHIAGATPLVQYACAVYWATMTSTTIGYGDIVMVTAFERTYATICMIIGASVYAFITSKLVGMLIFAPSSNSSPTVMTDNNTILGKFYQSPLVHQAILMDYLNNRQVNQANDGTRDYFLVSMSSHSLFPPTLPPFLHLPLAQLLSPRLRSLIAKTYYAEMVVYTQLLCPRHLTPHLLEEICGDVALVIEHETFMPGEIVVDKYDPQISPREYLYVVNNGGILLRRGSSLQTLSRHHSFGEDLVLLNQLRDESYQARVNPVSYCGLYMISKPNLLGLLSRYPLLSQQFQHKRLSLAFRLGVASAIRKILLTRYREDKKTESNQSQHALLPLPPSPESLFSEVDSHESQKSEPGPGQEVEGVGSL